MDQSLTQEDNQLVEVNVQSLLSHFKSKKELYRFLVVECQAFLPKIEATNYIKRSEVKVSAVPQIGGLSVADFLTYAKSAPRLLNYLPDEQDWNHVDKKWLCDLLYSIDTQNIEAMVHTAIIERREHLNKTQNLIVAMRPEIAEALAHSEFFSNSRGRSAFLLKESSHRKRTRKELEEVKDEEEFLKHDHQSFLKESKRIKQRQQNSEQEIKNLTQYKELVEHLHSSGVIDDSGQPNLK